MPAGCRHGVVNGDGNIVPASSQNRPCFTPQAEKISGRAVERDLAEYNEENGTGHRILMVPKFHCELAWVSPV